MRIASHEIEAGLIRATPANRHYIEHTLYITERMLDSLRDHGLSSPDKEVCGLITGNVIDGTTWAPDKYTSIANVSAGSYGFDDYVMDPNESMGVLQGTTIITPDAEKDLVAVFHTHPRSTPYPSSIDVEHAAYNVIYIIYSLRYDEFTFHHWDGEWFNPVKVGVIE